MTSLSEERVFRDIPFNRSFYYGCASNTIAETMETKPLSQICLKRISRDLVNYVRGTQGFPPARKISVK
jgi:hypothetical protein